MSCFGSPWFQPRFVEFATTCFHSPVGAARFEHIVLCVFFFGILYSSTFCASRGFAQLRQLRNMGSWQVSDLVAELQAMSTLLKARGDTAGDSPLAASLLKALTSKLKAAKEMSVNGLTEFMQACSTSSLPQSLIDQLLKEVENVAMTMANADSFGFGPASKIQQVPQELLNVPSYLSVADWEKLEAMDMENGIQVLVSRLRKLGMRPLKETTKKACAATLVLVQMGKGKPMPPYKEIYRLTQVFQQAFLASDVIPGDGVQSLCKYPSNAADLGAQALKKVYTPEDPRLPKHFSNLPYMMAHHIPVRNTSSLLNPAAGSNVTKTSHTQGNNGVEAVGSIGEMFLQRLGEQLSNSLAALVGNGQAQNGGAKVQFLGRKKSRHLLEDSNLNENNVLALPVHEPSHVLEPKPAAPAPRIDTPVPNTLPEPATKVSEEEQTKVQPAEQLEGQGLEDFEKQMFDSLREKEKQRWWKGHEKTCSSSNDCKNSSSSQAQSSEERTKGTQNLCEGLWVPKMPWKQERLYYLLGPPLQRSETPREGALEAIHGQEGQGSQMIACAIPEQVCDLGVWFQWQLLGFGNLACKHKQK